MCVCTDVVVHCVCVPVDDDKGVVPCADRYLPSSWTEFDGSTSSSFTNIVPGYF